MSVGSWLEQWFYRPGRNVLRVVSGRYFGVPQSIEPTANVDFRGALFLDAGDTGVADRVRICLKNDSDAYAWETIGGSPATLAMTVTTIDLGTSPLRSGSFTITTSGLTTGDPILITQIPGPYSGKGTRADEAEMGIMAISGVAESATTIRCYWTSNDRMQGNVRVAWIAVLPT